jgi:hypothetical protein
MKQRSQLRLLNWVSRPGGSACLAAGTALAATIGASNAQSPADGVAAQVRAQGYQCDQPISATRDASLSKPDSAVWTLKCKNSSYRVRLVPDLAADITKLGSGSK